MKIFESHAHLDFSQFDKDRDELIRHCFKDGIEYIINIGVDKKTIVNSLKLAEKYPQIYAAVGYHPHDAKVFERDFLMKSAKHPKVVAIGECGLDFFRNLSPREAQVQVFEEQIEIARKLKLPLVVHDREAHDECYEILSNQAAENVVFHCFSGDVLFAEKVLAKGWKISFTGTITYKNSQQENVVRLVPDDMFFIETDSPYLAPVPQRGKRNSPLNLRYVIEKIAEIRGISPKKVAELSFENAANFFLNSIK
jgi:TatD DNase family protein